MALVTNITKRVEIPHEQDGWMELKKLSWKQLENASDVASDALLDRMKKLGGDLLSALRESAEGQKQDPAQSYDRDTILRLGIKAWSYGAEVKPDTIADLDEETAAWAFNEILSLNKPKTEEEVKNG